MGRETMVSQGYWLQVPGHDWRRVRLEDYLTAADNAGFYIHLGGDPAARPPQDFVDHTTGMRGTTTDPNSRPVLEAPEFPRADGRPPVLQAADVPANVSEAITLIETTARQLLRLGQHLAQIAEVYRSG